MNAGGYLRVSTGRQDEANQEPEVRRLIEARGWHPLIFRERESGAKDRPIWDQVMAAARSGEVRAVVIWSLDRVGRTMWQVLRDVTELTRLGCAVVSVREPWLDTGGPVRDLLLAIFSWVAQHERERLRERTRAGLERARAAGKRFGRPPANIPPEVVKLARKLRHSRGGPGMPWREVAHQLAMAGHKQPAREGGARPHRARAWPPGTLSDAVALSEKGSEDGGR